MFFVVVVDNDEWEYHSHHIFASHEEAVAFQSGMKAAWEISRGYYNCWSPFVVSSSDDMNELLERNTSFITLTDDRLREVLRELQLVD